jgi:hypothetical protein
MSDPNQIPEPKADTVQPAVPPTAVVEMKALREIVGSIYTRFGRIWQSWSSARHIAQLIALLILVNIGWAMFGRQITGIWRQMHTLDGFIIVDSPEVYTRERLINERLGEDTWLRERLEEADDENSLVGIRRVIKRRLAIGAGTDQPIENAEKKTETGTPTKTATSEITTETVPSINDDILTFDQKVRIKSANRDFIQQRMIENRLDDRHDLVGNSLYVLKFDTTVVSNDFDNRKAVVEVYVVPPIPEPAKSTEPDSRPSPMDVALREDRTTLEFIRQSFTQFIRDSEDRVNVALAEIQPGSPYSDDAIKKAVSQKFGYQQGASAVAVRKKPLAGAGGLAVWTQYNLSIGSISNFVDFFYLEQTGVPAVPTFRAQEKSVPFQLFSESCITEAKRRELSKQYPISEAFELPENNGFLASYFGGSENPQLRLFLEQSGYQYREPKSRRSLLALIAKSFDAEGKMGDSITLPWGTITLADYAMPSSDSAGSVADSHCKSVLGFINVGFLKFAESVGQSNTYSYSVLPRQSAVSVVDEIVENSASRLSFKAADSLLTSMGIGTIASETNEEALGSSLNSRVTSFGDARQEDQKSGIQIAVGWIIDPKAGRVALPRNDLTTTAESVMAIVSVPSWWPYLKLTIKKSWLTADGSLEPTTRNDEIFADSPNDGAGETTDNTIVVNLPNSQQLLDSSLIGAGKRGPKLESAICENVLNNKSEDLGKSKRMEMVCVIRGKKLWRNTVVTYGPIEHTALKILPDMEGLIASFPEISLDCKRGLAVWTSEGRDDLLSTQCKSDGNAITYSSFQ